MARLRWFAVLGALALPATMYGGGGSRSFTPGAEVVDWPTTDGRGGSHYSPLSDITADNVASLEVAWSYRTGDVQAGTDGMAGTAFEATPIMIDGRLFVSTPYSRAIALDAESGQELWTFDPGIDRTDRDHAMVTSRGLAHWQDVRAAPTDQCAGRIFLAAYDGRLFALDAVTGVPCPDFNQGQPIYLRAVVNRIDQREHLYSQTAPPTVVNDVVVVGSSIIDGHYADSPSGVVRAFDARTGAERWSFEPLLGVGAPGPDGEWIPAGAANTWATMTADAERDLIFLPTGSPSPDHFGGLRPGDNAYANALVALRASTGEVVWHFQAVHHDLWDYDLPSPPALIELERQGQSLPAVVLATKMGYLFVFHRETGEPLFPIVERPVPASDVPGEVASATQPVPMLPRPLSPQGLGADDAWGLTPFDRAACRRRMAQLRSDGMYAPPSERGTISYPGLIGGMEWGGMAFDPRTGLLLTNTNRVAMVTTLIPREQADDLPRPAPGSKFSIAAQERTPYAVRREPLLSPLGVPCSPPPFGMLHAVDMKTGAVAWEVPLGRMTDLVGVPTPKRWGSPNLGGPLVTGGLAFIGASMDRTLRAFDLTTGAVVWTFALPASAQSSPLTYRARPGGRQFLVIAAGGHHGLGSRLGDHVVAFALPNAGPRGQLR